MFYSWSCPLICVTELDHSVVNKMFSERQETYLSVIEISVSGGGTPTTDPAIEGHWKD